MASRFENVPEDFLNHLRESVPGFNLESYKHQFELARMAWIGVNKANEHCVFENALTFQASDLDRAFGRSKFKLVNGRIGFFNWTPGWSKAKKFTRGYYFSEVVRVAIKGYLASSPWDSMTTLRMADGKALKTIPAAVSSKDKSDVTTRAWKSANALTPVSVNLEQLLKLKAELLTACSEWLAGEDAKLAPPNSLFADYERTSEMICKVCRMAMTDVSGVNYIAHRYEEAQSGRLYPIGISLASTKTVVKDAALTGNWEYDISNCHFAILAQMASTFGFECPVIHNYLNRKEETRSAIAEQAGITLRQTKTCLVALMYGARASAWHENAIPKEIGTEAAERLYAVPQFRSLGQEIRTARDAILSKYARTPKGGIKNAFGKTIAGTSKKAEQMAHLLQGVEAKALQAVINLHPDDIVLVQHDGFVSRIKLDVNALSNAIADATGYRLKLEEKCLSADAYKYFESRLR